jgi:hypothetical protein
MSKKPVDPSEGGRVQAPLTAPRPAEHHEAEGHGESGKDKSHEKHKGQPGHGHAEDTPRQDSE